MWPRLKKQIAVEREMLRTLFSDHGPLIDKCGVSAPDRIEISALAAMLHGFYNGIENIFKRIAIELDEGLPEGPAWHKELLSMMSRPVSSRPAVISEDLSEKLREYLEFRHFFRSAYTFQILWERMAHLVLGCQEVFNQLESELDKFIETVEAGK
ncbi:MAG: hypothetical protein R6V10_15400 [bacterium]